MATEKLTKKNALEMALDFLAETDCPQEVMDKLAGMVAQEVKRAEYAATHKKPSKAKGPGAETLARAEQIKAILTDSPATTAEINQMLGTDFSALQVANATKYIEGVNSSKVIREVVDKNGLHVERQYTAYFIG